MTAVPDAQDPQRDRAIETVLIVDDSRVQRRILAASFARWGYRVIEAGSGAEALTICAGDPPDLVISDWMMPGMSGLEFCRAFRDLPRRGYGYFILLTSKSGTDEIAAGLEAGADDFLTKPVSSAELRARVSAGERIVGMERDLSDKNRLVEATLTELQRLYDALDSDLIEARKLQQSLVPERHRDFGGAQVSLLLRPSGHVGGDLVGMYPVTDTRIGLFSIDVSGHGISSALMTARLAGYLSAATLDQNIAVEKDPGGGYRPRDLARAVSDLNALILTEMETEHYFTLVLADIDLATGDVRMVQAGHPHPVVQRRDGDLHPVGCGGLPVGLIDGATFETEEFRLDPGDRLIIHSDGVTECADPQGRMLGQGGLERLIDANRDLRGMPLLESVVWSLTDYADSAEFDDDVSAVLLEITPSPGTG